MVWVPVAKVEVAKLAVDTLPLELSELWPMLVAASKNVTVPLGLADAVLPGELALSVAVNVTSCPGAEGLGDELIVVVVLALLTVCPPAKVPLLPVKLPSPL